MAEGQRSWTGPAALGSVVAPVSAGGLALLCSGWQPGPTKIILGGAATALISVGAVLAITAFVGSLRQSRNASLCIAGAGLGLNSLLLLGLITLVPVVGSVQNAGYTVEQMRAMPRVIPGSRMILNEDLGFRVEIPGGFMDNRAPQPPRMLYSFLHADANGVDLCVSIERLGGRVAKGPLGPEFYEGLRRSVPPDAQIEQAAVFWRTHQLDAFRVQYSMGGRVLSAWTVQVPLAREAIQIGVGGRPEASEESRKLLEQLLTGLEGISNWDSPAARMASLSLRPGPRASRAAEPAEPTAGPGEAAVTPGHSELRSFPGVVPPDSEQEFADDLRI